MLRVAFSHKPTVSDSLTVTAIKLRWGGDRQGTDPSKKRPESSGLKIMLNPEMYSSVRTESLQISYTVAFNNCYGPETFICLPSLPFSETMSKETTSKKLEGA